MSAEAVRRAAELMRERAEAIVPDGYGEKWFHPSRIKACLLSWPNREDEKYGAFHAARDAEHIASWSPTVALAVADWLDDQLDAFLHVRPGSHLSTQKALAVARAYLGSDA